MKGIILAGGHGTRLAPLTNAFSKQLLPVYDKPMIYYPITTLMLAGIKDFVIITTPTDLPLFMNLLGDGGQWGISVQYRTQAKPKGIADALLIAEDFIKGDSVALILGDNIFYGQGLGRKLAELSIEPSDALVMVKQVQNPSAYGVLELTVSGEILNIVEKPNNPKSNHIATGLYFFGSGDLATERAKRLTPSQRDELEIVDVLRDYLDDGNLKIQHMGTSSVWFDMGTFEGLHEAGVFVRIMQRHQGVTVGSPGNIAIS